MGNWTDRFDPETVDEIKRYEVGEGDFLLLKPITTEKEITGHIGDTILSWCEKGQKDDGGNEFRD